MKRFLIWLILFGLLGLTMVLAGNTATQTVGFQVDPINEISVSGNPPTLIINTATAGSQPNPVSDSSTYYNITTNETAKKITGVIDQAMPAGVTLKVTLAAPTGATSLGAQTLTTTAVDLVTGITQVAETNKTITYELSATVAAGVVTYTTRVVTLTLQ